MKFHFKGRIPCGISRNALLLTGILVLGAVLRFNNITQPLIDSFNWRQASTAMMASNFYHKSWNIFYPEVSWTATSPGYQGREFQTVGYIAALLYLIAGEHDWIGRSVAVLFGLCGVGWTVRPFLRERIAIVHGGETSLIRPYPISIEWPNRWSETAPPAAECRREVFAELGLPADALPSLPPS